MLQGVAPLKPDELALLNELFTTKFGIHFPEHKREILESRLLPRLRANRVQRFIDYYLLLQYDFQRELDPLTRAITNNESYFFRETSQFEALEGYELDKLKESPVHPGRLRFLSAGCSSGEEPYTLNIFLRRFCGPLAAPDTLQIDAIDLDSERLEMARQGVYRMSSLRAMNEEKIDRYFHRRDGSLFELRSTYRQGISFTQGNIVDLPSIRGGGAYDAIFCRNVLIYFSEEALKTTIENFAEIVRPGGLLFLGHSESIIGLTKAFQAERLGQCIAYRRKSE